MTYRSISIVPSEAPERDSRAFSWYDHAEKLVNGRDIFWGEWKHPKAELIEARLPLWPVCKSPRCIRCNPETATPYVDVA